MQWESAPSSDFETRYLTVLEIPIALFQLEKRFLPQHNLELNVPRYFAAFVGCLVVYRVLATVAVYVKVRYFI